MHLIMQLCLLSSYTYSRMVFVKSLRGLYFASNYVYIFPEIRIRGYNSNLRLYPDLVSVMQFIQLQIHIKSFLKIQCRLICGCGCSHRNLTLVSDHIHKESEWTRFHPCTLLTLGACQFRGRQNLCVSANGLKLLLACRVGEAV